MADDIEVLVTELRVSMKGYEASMRRQARLTEQTASKVERRYEQMNRKVASSTDQMSKDVRRAIVAIALGAGAKEVTKYADAWVDLNNKLKSSSQISGVQARSLNDIQASAKASRSEIEPYVNLYSRLLRVSGKLAASEMDVSRATEIVTRSFKAGGAASSEQAAGVMQLGQALNGILGGDELRSVRENAPLLFEGIAKGLGVTSDKLKDMGAKGELTGKKVFDAILKSGADIDAAFAVTIPKASDAAVLAFDRLQVKVGEYLNDTGTVADVSKALGEVINYVADNVGMFADALVVAGAAVTGALGAQAALSVVTSLNSIAVGTTSAAKAMSVLRAASAFMFGPAGIIIGVAAVAAGLAYLAIKGNEVAKEFEASRKAATTAGEALKAYNKEAAPEILQRQAVDLSKIKEEYYGIANAAIAAAEAEKQRRIEALLSERQAASKGLDALKTRRGSSSYKRAGNLDERKSLDADIATAEKLLKAYDEAITKAGNQSVPMIAKELGPVASGGGADPSKEAVKSVEALKKAYLAQTESQREEIARTLKENLKAIDEAGGAESERVKLRTQANDLYISQLADIREAEGKEFDAFVDDELKKSKIKEDQAKQERDIMNDLLDRRDELAGHTLGIIQREYEARRLAIEDEIKDAGKKAEALKLLEEEQAATTAKVREELLGKGEFSDKEVDRVRAAGEAKLEALKEGLEEEAITREEYAARKIELEAETEQQLQDIRAASIQMQLQAGEQLFGGLAGLAKTFAGEQSGVYKALFAVEKAASIASAIIAIQTGVARALSLPFPANIAAGATVAAQGASVVATIASTAANFRDGGIDIRGAGTGRSDSIPANISRGESVITAAGTAANRGILAAINAGANVESALGARRGGSSVSIGSTQLVVQGDIGTAETLDALQASLDRRDAMLRDNVLGILQRDAVETTPRHRR